MKIHSDKILFSDIHAAVPSGCYLADFIGRDEQMYIIESQGSRKRKRGYVVRLSGSSRYNMDSRRLVESAKSATWDEWGNFIAALFDIDPHAIIGVYEGRNNFIDQTQSEHERISLYRPDLAHTHSAPWLYA